MNYGTDGRASRAAADARRSELQTRRAGGTPDLRAIFDEPNTDFVCVDAAKVHIKRPPFRAAVSGPRGKALMAWSPDLPDPGLNPAASLSSVSRALQA